MLAEISVGIWAEIQPTCFKHFCQTMFFHEWAPDGRWGAHRTIKIRVVAMRVCLIYYIYIYIYIYSPEDVFWPREVS